MKNRVPERWEAYKSMGRQIPGTRFICFKVPLREEIGQNAVRKGAEWFCPRTLMDHCHNLGLVVDLTYTNRFYDPEVFTNQGVRYGKILTQGKIIPKQKVIKQFFKIVNNFLEENKENEKLIGVHCTHGLNRTGYLVCRYMIQHLGIPPDQAIADFNSARGHEQEREDYLTNLRQMSWVNEPAPSASEDEEGEGEEPKGQRIPTTITPVRRSKRNLDDVRDEDEGDESWPTGPVRKWPRTPHTQRKHYGPNWQQHSGGGGSSSYDSPGYEGRSSGPQRNRQRNHKVQTSPYEAQRYYDNYYRGRVAPQYDSSFYQRQGSGMAPQRQSPRWTSRNVQWETSTYGGPRQYRGPRQYSTPPQRERETLNDSYNSNHRSYEDRSPADVRGPRRNPFSPGTSDNIFSPATPRYRRRRN